MEDETLPALLGRELKRRFPRRYAKGETIGYADAIAHIESVTGVKLAKTNLVDYVNGRARPSDATLYVLSHSLGLPLESLKAAPDRP